MRHFPNMQDPFILVLGAGFMFSGIITLWRARTRKATMPEKDSHEFIPSRWPPKSLRFAGAGMFLVGLLMLLGACFHLL